MVLVMKKVKLIFLLVIVLSLSSCFGQIEPTDIEQVTTNLTEEKINNVATKIPSSFVTLVKNNKTKEELIGSGVIFFNEDNLYKAVICLDDVLKNTTGLYSLYLDSNNTKVDATIVEYEEYANVIIVSFTSDITLGTVDLSNEVSYKKGEDIVVISSNINILSTDDVSVFNSISVGNVTNTEYISFSHTVDYYDTCGSAVYNINGDFLGLTYKNITAVDDIAIYGMNFAYTADFLNLCVKDTTLGITLGLTVTDSISTVNDLIINCPQVVEITPNSLTSSKVLAGDLICEVNGYKISFMSQIKECLSMLDENSSLTITVYRANEKIEIKII